ncbi:hypothetical protein [Streptomyces sp. NPDC002156]
MPVGDPFQQEAGGVPADLPVHEGRTPLARAEGVRFIGYADGVYACRLASGRYRLTARLR